ncbi:GntR family transcriptional regulator [Pseudogemmobacter sp. W21_MBD1_M6]|uniref:GntR family transcriptional regulator n=1 Tax=Pseudogemmobacter sp. W21_MBD1_M6 TaxID=3240271 RepID=UPI003F9E16A7
MSDRNALPRYIQTAELLIREIMAGRLLDGERLAPEREMAGELGISVGTLRKALADMTEKGLLERRQGSGNYVRHSAEHSGVYALFRLELPEGGGLPTADALSVQRLPKPAAFPDFGPSPEGHRIRRLRRLNQIPVAVEEIWLDGRFSDRIEIRDLSESLYLFYRTRLGLWISRAEDRIGINTVPDWAPDTFGQVPGAPCGYIERISWDQDNARAEFSRTWFDNNKSVYVSRLK